MLLKKKDDIWKATNSHIGCKGINMICEKCGADMKLGKNRGSIEYEQKKMLTQLSLLLQERDENDNMVRLNQCFMI